MAVILSASINCHTVRLFDIVEMADIVAGFVSEILAYV